MQNSVEMDSWVHPAGKFVLLGDACHATLPYLAQGAAQAVEDGAVLGGLLAHVSAADKDNLRPLLDSFEALRKSRTTAVVQGSTALRNVFHMEDGDGQVGRDSILRADKPTKRTSKCHPQRNNMSCLAIANHKQPSQPHQP